MGRNFTILVFLFLGVAAWAQKIKVLSATSLEPVVNVSVFNRTNSFSAVTDENGIVNVIGMKDSDTLHFQHVAYHSLSLTLREAREKNFKVLLTDKVLVLGELVVAASKTSEKQEEVANQVDIIKSSEIAFSNAPTTAHVLENSGNIFVQRSQMGGGSPVLRGFEANRVLLVVDGVRMNNVIYRTGHLQNVLSMDDAVLERVEVVYGPGSLIYGSDALGGVMHFYTKQPQLSEAGSLLFKLNAFTRFASANLEKTGHADFNLGWEKVASFSSFTFTDFNDLRMGSRQNPFYGDFGKRHEYVERINGEDKIIENDNPLIQKFTGYRQMDVLQKFLFPLGSKADLTFNFQLSTTSNVPRYDFLQETEQVEVIDSLGDTTQVERLRWAEWNYGPQTRIMAAADISLQQGGQLYDEGKIVTAYQKVFEERIQRRFGKNGRTDRLENVDVFTLNADLVKKFHEKNMLQYGMEAIYNHVTSTAETKDIVTGEITPASTRYPEGGTSYQSYSAYLKFTLKASDKVVIAPGFRFSQIMLKAKYEESEFYEFEFDEVNINTSAFSGSFGIVYNPGKNWHLNLLVSSGYRSPNLDNVGKVFSPQPKQVVIPNDGLQPEYAYNVEAGVSKQFYDKVKVSAVFYNTLMKNRMVILPFTLNGADSVLYDGEMAKVYANVNVGKAVIRGVSVNLDADITQHYSLSSSFNYVYGNNISEDAPLDHIPPIFGQTGFITRYGKFKGEFFVRYNGWKHAEDYSPSGEDNLESATEYGMPAWYTLNLRAAYQFNRYFRLQLALENILDQHYRPFASGVSAPGINCIVTAKVGF
ncbi:MAG TPA: TonB-dependent receptor [Chitinophagales bacterium]|nr:TonB-dependent receptor [Chitinophagales bacterium]